MFGEDILFAPIVNKGQTDRTVYLPTGTWTDVNNKKEYAGSGYVEMHAELESLLLL